MARQTRRTFLKQTGSGVVGLGLGALPAGRAMSAIPTDDATLEKRNVVAGMKYNRMGRTNMAVSILSSGVIKETVLLAALERGINFVHTNFGYNNVPDIGRVAKKHRDRLFIGVKGWEIDKYLKELDVDYVDVQFMARLNAKEARDSNGRHRENFERLKQQGKVRFLGTTIHSDDLAGVTRAAAESDTWDIIMPQYPPQLRKELDPILARARERGIGVLAMKSMINIDRRAYAQQEAALRTAVAGNVDSVIRSIESLEILKRYVDAALQPAERADFERLDEAVASAQGRFCASCGTCSGCPRGVGISEILKCKDYYAVQMNDPEFARSEYVAMPASRRATNCADCGRCERVCPQRLPVRRMLREAHGMFV